MAAIVGLTTVLLSACGGGGGDAGSGYTVAVTVTVSGLGGSGLLLQNNGGDTVAIAGNGVASFTLRSPTGTPYAAAVARQPVAPAQGCVVANGSGSIGTSDVVTDNVSCRNAARFAYVANYGGNNVTQFSVGGDGKLSLLATPFVAAGVKPTRLALDPAGQFLYVAHASGNSIVQFSITDDGRLAQTSTTFQVATPIAMVMR